MDISTLSDEELNRAVLWVVNNPDCGEIDTNALGYGFGSSTLNYLSDWSLTGPLMVKYDCALMPRKGDSRGPLAQICVKSNNNPPYHEENSGYRYFESNNMNPLRAICECILMIEIVTDKQRFG